MDTRIKAIRSFFDTIPDHRTGKISITMSDTLMSAYAMFSLKEPSLLAFQERQKNPSENFRSIFGIQVVPSDTQFREILDPVDPELLRPIYLDAFRQLQRGKVLERFRYLDGHYLLSLDETTYFSSDKIHCPSCLEKTHKNGDVTYSHQMLGQGCSIPISKK